MEKSTKSGQIEIKTLLDKILVADLAFDLWGNNIDKVAKCELDVDREHDTALLKQVAEQSLKVAEAESDLSMTLYQIARTNVLSHEPIDKEETSLMACWIATECLGEDGHFNGEDELISNAQEFLKAA